MVNKHLKSLVSAGDFLFSPELEKNSQIRYDFSCMYTKQQQQTIVNIREKVRTLFANYSAPAHGFDHVARVASWAKKIAELEKSNVFLCEIAGWLHDIGRTRMHNFEASTHGHHDHSYEMCREWFKNDPIFSNLTKRERMIILYAVRYHWNNAADKYDVAWILRDADKLDGFGKIGIKRSLEFVKDDYGKLMLDFRLRYDNVYWIKTESAKKLIKKHKMIEPIDAYYTKELKSKIEPVEL